MSNYPTPNNNKLPLIFDSSIGAGDGLAEALGLSDGLSDDDGLMLELGLRDGLSLLDGLRDGLSEGEIELEGLKDGDSLLDGEILELGERDGLSLGLSDGDSELDGERELDGELAKIQPSLFIVSMECMAFQVAPPVAFELERFKYSQFIVPEAQERVC